MEKLQMKVVIAGAGETGFYLAQILLKEQHELTLIERDAKACRYAQERLDAQVIQGNCSDALVLEPLMDEDVDLFVAVTNSDEANIIASLIARKFGVQRVIARVCEPTNLIHPLLTDDPNVSVINSEMTVAKDLNRLIGNPSADEIEFFAGGKAELVKFHVEREAVIAFKKLEEVEIPRSWLFVARIRGGEFEIISGDTSFRPGDQVLVMGSPKKSKEIEDLLGLHPVKVKRIILLGFNDISSSVAQTLHRRGIEVRLIEESREVAEQAAAELDGVLVLHGDGTSDEILEQAGIDAVDYLLALTDDDENNVLISLLAKEKDVNRVVALAQKPQYKPIIEKIGIDSVVSPRSAMVHEIMRSIHHKELSGIYILEEGQGQAIEVVIQEGNKLVGKVISKVKIPKQTLVGAIVRNQELIIPRGEDCFEVGDHLVIFTVSASLSEVRKLFT